MKSEHVNSPTVAMDHLSITIIYDNNPFKTELLTGWGYSCLIRGVEKTILFDTGGDGAVLLANMKKLAIDPGEIDIAVLSHIHGDHVGGLERFLEVNHEVTVYLPQSFPTLFKDKLRSSRIKIREIHGSTKICKNVYSTGECGPWIKEQSLIVRTERGGIVITGCAHPGIIKIIKEAKKIIHDEHVILTIGGFHLLNQSKKELGEMIYNFRELGVMHVGPCHCSGELARQMFFEEYQEYFIDVGAGKVISGMV